MKDHEFPTTLLGRYRAMLNLRTSPSRRSLSKIYDDFFFKKEKPYGLAIVRIILPLVIFWDLSSRWVRARELFSLDGTPTPIWESYGVYDWLPLFSGSVVVAMMTALMFLLITLAIGWCTRLSAIGVTLLFTYLTMTDSVSTMTKCSVIGSHVLFLLSLSHCGIVWSVDAWLKKRKYLAEHPDSSDSYEVPSVYVWQQRLVQLLIGVIYFGAALTKMHTAAFFTGDQMFHWSLTELNHENSLGEYIALVLPMVLVFAAYITIVWEVLFIFLVWGRGWGRFCMISLGLTFHLLTCLLLGLYFFPLTFAILYCSFLDEKDIRSLSLRFRYWARGNRWAQAIQASLPQWRPRLPQIKSVPQPALFMATVCVVVLLGIEAEHQIDPYGLRRPEGPYQLVEMDPQEVSRLFTPPQNIRRKDTIHDMSIGTVVVAQYLADPRTTFQQGEKVIVQVKFSPPHPDMAIECDLYDSQHRLVRRNSQVAERGSTRMHYGYYLDGSIEPGDYYFILKSAGEQLHSRKISITAGNVHSPVAN